MRDYVAWRGRGNPRAIADLSTSELHEILADIAAGYAGNGAQCTAEQMAERVRIELVARSMGVGGNACA